MGLSPAFRWDAGVSLAATASDRLGGGNRSGWFLQVAPRLSVERPALVGAWLAYEPSVAMRDAGPDSDLDPVSIEQLGSIGLRIGAESGLRLTIDGARRFSHDAVRADDEGLTDHTESMAGVTAALAAPERANLSLRAQRTAVRYSLPRYQPADHDRAEAILEANVRLLVRSTVGLRLHGSSVEYPDPPDGEPRTIETGAALATLSAQLTPATAIQLAAGPEVRRDPDTSVSVPVSGALTADLNGRMRAEVSARAETQDSLWRENRRVHVMSARAGLSSDVLSNFDASAHGGVTQARYPGAEQPGNFLRPIHRTDWTWSAGGSLSYHSRGRLRATLSYDRIERRSNFPAMEWGENRCSLSGFFTW